MLLVPISLPSIAYNWYYLCIKVKFQFLLIQVKSFDSSFVNDCDAVVISSKNNCTQHCIISSIYFFQVSNYRVRIAIFQSDSSMMKIVLLMKEYYKDQTLIAPYDCIIFHFYTYIFSLYYTVYTSFLFILFSTETLL